MSCMHNAIKICTRLVRIDVSVMLPYHRSLLGSCPLARGLCLEAQQIPRRRLETPPAAADVTERPAALRCAPALSDINRGASPGGLCAPVAPQRGAQRSPRVDIDTFRRLLPGQGENTCLTGSKHSGSHSMGQTQAHAVRALGFRPSGTPRGAVRPGVRTRGAAARRTAVSPDRYWYIVAPASNARPKHGLRDKVAAAAAAASAVSLPLLPPASRAKDAEKQRAIAVAAAQPPPEPVSWYAAASAVPPRP